MKKTITFIVAIICIGLIWYLFFKPSDYTVRVKAKTFPGAINQTLKLWDQTLDTVKKIEENNSIYNLTQKVRFGDSIHRYDWKIKPLTDSTSKIIVNIKDLDNSFSNKIKVPFTDTDFEKRSRKTVLNFMENLNDHIDNFKVTIKGKAEIPSKYVAYIPIKTTQFQKAGGMMKNASYIEQTLLRNKVEFDGLPRVEITRWQTNVDSLEYNFCYPIQKTDSLPKLSEIKYKQISSKPAIKAEYNGNYITSDRAWYALINYAKKNNIKVAPTPLEVFYNNPSVGADELNWKTEIYLPIIENE